MSDDLLFRPQNRQFKLSRSGKGSLLEKDLFWLGLIEDSSNTSELLKIADECCMLLWLDSP